jgi:radical SAM superfamily enzyme YgiQ (UPF0313 family)
MRWDKKARRRLSDERGTIVKDWGGRIPVALIYPNTYYIGMSNLGLHTIYSLLNGYDDIVCERFFDEGEGVSIESGRPLSDFAVLAFSISTELDYFNVVEILKKSTIPLLSSERGNHHPLVIAGGPCISANPEPLSPFFDCFAVGEGEAIIPALIEAIAGSELRGRDELLQVLSSLPGIYVPSLLELYRKKPVSRQWVKDIDDFATTSAILTPHTEFGDMYLIEVTRGCRWGCRFCLAGYWFRPLRFRSLNNLLEQSREGLNLVKRIGLLGASVSDHPEIGELATQLRREGAQISVSSLRVRPLSPVLLQALAEGGTATVTLAPEAGSERLRRVINKGVSQSDIVAAVDAAGEQGFRQLKLYFMVGLPTETAEDIEELINLVLGIKQRLDATQTGTHLTITIEPFVPKAGTPFQWLPMASPKVLSHRISWIKGELERKGVTVRAESVPWSMVQGVLSRGDRKLSQVLARAEGRSLASWRLALSELSVEAESYTAKEIPFDRKLPWDVLDSGVGKDYLRQEMERALRGEESPPCPSIECHKCGVC